MRYLLIRDIHHNELAFIDTEAEYWHGYWAEDVDYAIHDYTHICEEERLDCSVEDLLGCIDEVLVEVLYSSDTVPTIEENPELFI